jgi:hypothetical protein
MSLPFYITPKKRNRPWIFDPWPLGYAVFPGADCS